MSELPVRHVYTSDTCLYCAGTLIFCRIVDKNGVWHYRVGCEDCRAINPKSVTSTIRSLCQVPALHTLPHFLTKVQRSEDAASIPLHRPPDVLQQAYSAMSQKQKDDVHEFQRRMSCSLLHAVDAILGWGNTEPEPEKPITDTERIDWFEDIIRTERLSSSFVVKDGNFSIKTYQFAGPGQDFCSRDTASKATLREAFDAAIREEWEKVEP